MKFRFWAVLLATLLLGLAAASCFKQMQWFAPALLLSLGGGIYMHKRIELLEAQAQKALEDASTLGTLLTFIAISVVASVIDGYVWQAGWWILPSAAGSIIALIFGAFASHMADDEAKRFVHATS